MPNAPGRDNGTRDNYVASNRRTSTRTHSTSASTAGWARHQHLRPLQPGKFHRDGPTAFGSRRRSRAGESRRSLRRLEPEPRLRPRLRDFELAACRFPLRLLPLQRQCVPGRLRHDASGRCGDSRSQYGQEFHVGLPVRRRRSSGDRGVMVRTRAWTPTAATARSTRTRTSSSSSATSQSCVGGHTFKAGVDIRRAHNLRVPSDAHRSGQLTFSHDRTRGVDGGLGLATFLLGDVHRASAGT